MHFSTSLITKFVLFSFVLLSTSYASDVPGYIGSQSFRLSDDYELRNLINRADEAKIEYSRAEQSQDQLGDQVRILENQLDNLKNQMADALNDVKSLEAQKASLINRLEEYQKNPAANADAISKTQSEISSVENEVATKKKIAGALKLESAPISVRLDQVRNDFNTASRNVENARNRFQNAARERDDYREELLVAIKKINYEGSRVGQSDGTMDGADLSRRMGRDRGENEGSNDGFSQGQSDGQDRFYRRGAEQGERDGSARARLDGERDGRREGLIAGNKSAGSREGLAAGIVRANKSDAATVGIAQGKKAGLERAVKTGEIEGRIIGEGEITKKYEVEELNKVIINGAFAGSFQRRTPSFPGEFNGPNYKPRINHSKEILAKAFFDGYVYLYHQYTRFEFLRRIDTDYNSYYDEAYKVSYQAAVSRDYPAYYEQGRKDADSRAYSRDYPIVKAETFQIAFQENDKRPDRSSREFQQSFEHSELAAYNQRYEEIRFANFDKVEKEVFNANIAAQTEIFRQKRAAEVTSLYKERAVIQFIGSEMFDGGIKGVAKLDGVYQPGELTNHTITIKNFGFVEARNVAAILSSGAVVKLPSIAARSSVTIKGAVQGVVDSSVNTNFKSSLKVTSVLETKDSVEARHFEKGSEGILKSADVKSVAVQYPLALSGLSFENQLLKDVKNKLKLSITNNSKRDYNEELNIKVLINSQNEILTKEFSPITNLKTTLSLSDAEALVTSEDDIYRDLSLSAQVYQNGVLVGVLAKDLQVMAKAQYKDLGKVPVLVANTNSHLNDFLDALELLGGTSKVSILDLSLSQLNSTIINSGLSQKVLMIVDDVNGSSIKGLNTFVGLSKTSTFVFIDQNNSGQKNVQALPALKEAIKLPLGKRLIVFSNPHRATGVTKSSAFIQSSIKNVLNDLELARTLALSAPEMMSEIKEKITPQNFSTPQDLLKVLSLKSLSEILAINMAYDESGGIFSRDKKWPKMIEEDTSLIHNQLKAASSGSVVVSKLPFVLSALALKDTISQSMARGDGIYREMKLKITNTTNGVLNDMEDSFKKSLKNNFKEIYNMSYENASKHRPFFIPEPTVPGNN